MKLRYSATALAFSLLCLLSPIQPGTAQEGEKLHALTLGDAPKYGPDFKHLDYVNPDAPKGGTVTYGAIGTFDSFNPYIIKGTPAGVANETLTTSTDDDSLTEYGLIAESMEIAPDKSWIIFNLRPEARWHDGKPITADDVVFSLDILKEKGDPRYRYYYKDVTKVEKLADLRVKFTFSSGGNRELPVIMGQLPVLPKHYWEKHNFENVATEPPLGSGPYKIDKFDLGRSYTLKRVPDYWGKDLPINIGTNNIDTLRYEFFRDPTVALEAFKSGVIDIRQENRAKDWATAYNFPAVKDGRIIKEQIPHKNPAGMQAFVFNIRKPIFQDRKLRQALIEAFDFEWSNKALFFGQYTRTRSYFQNSEMEAKGLPSPEELEVLEPFRGKIPDEVFTAEYNPPKTDGSGNNRENLERAGKLLDEAGWKVESGNRVKDGKTLAFEILLDDPAFQRIAEPYIQNLKKLGIVATLRVVDDSQYQKRVEDFDFDMISVVFGQSLSPGNEQREYWGSDAADQNGSNNLIGIKNQVIDDIVEQLVTAQTRKDLIIRCKALDRVLQWNYYVVPHWHLPAFRYVWWNKFSQPAKRPEPLYGAALGSWWIDPAKERALHQKMAQAEDPAGDSDGSGMPTVQEAEQTTPGQREPTPDTNPAAPDRGQSPILYLLAGLAAIAVVVMMRRKKK